MKIIAALIAVSAVLATALPSAAAGDRPAAVKASSPDAKAASADATQDLVFLSDDRPVFFRLHLTAGGKGFRTSWIESVRKFHAYLDHNGDGKLTKEEADRGALPSMVRAVTGGTSALPRADLDTNPKDGVVSLDELADVLRTALGPFRVQVDRLASERTDALFGQLDRNKDGMLSSPELAAASTSLRSLDLDDDDLIDFNELEPFTNPMAMATEDDPANRRARYTAVPPVLELTPDDPSFRPVRLLLKRYDKGGKGARPNDNRLSRSEFGLDDAAFKKADTDADGVLDTEELRRLLAKIQPDVELSVGLSADASGKATIEFTGANGGPLPPYAKATRLSGGDVELAFDEVHIEFHVDDGEQAAADAKQYYAGQFKAADGDNNGYLEKSEFKDKDHPPVMAQLFDMLDRDGNGKLYPNEVDEFVDRQSEAARSRMVLAASDQGRAIFAILDLNRDRRLGIRELRESVARVNAWDHDGNKRVGSDEIPHHYQLTIGRARLSGPNMGAVRLRGMMGNEPEDPAATGPSWFRRMDRNRDGDISRREFFGASSTFDRLDADHDGLIDAKEAVKADAVAKSK
jgi:Ca2+-binding EF-hand superfamily protein